MRTSVGLGLVVLEVDALLRRSFPEDRLVRCRGSSYNRVVNAEASTAVTYGFTTEGNDDDDDGSKVIGFTCSE